MKVPIAKIEDGRSIKYLMYDTETTKKSIMTKQEIENSKEKIIGFSFNVVGACLSSYFENLGYIGKEPDEPNVKYYTVIRQIFQPDVTEYIVIKRDGDAIKLEKRQLIDLINKGNKVAGVKLVNGEILKVFKDIEEIYSKYPKYRTNQALEN